MLRKILLTIAVLFMVISFAQAGGVSSMFSEGKKHLRKNQIDFAFLRFSHIAKFYPNSPYADESQFRVGEYYFRKKKYRSAMIELEAYLERFPEGKFRRQAQSYIEGIAAGKAVKNADELVKLRRWQEALKLYAQALKADPQMQGLRAKLEACKEKVVEELIKEGELLAANQKWHKASEVYTRAFKLDPGKSFLEERIEEAKTKLAQQQEMTSQSPAEQVEIAEQAETQASPEKEVPDK